MIDLLQKARQPFNSNSIAQAAAIGALEDADWVMQCRRRNQDGLKQMEEGLTKLGFDFVKSYANFILVNVGGGKRIFDSLQKKGFITRPMPGSIENYLRISIGTEIENIKLLSALEEELQQLKIE